MASSSWDWTARRRVRFYIRQAIRHRPRVYFPLVRRRKRPYMLVNGARMVHTGVVHDGTRIVIEGYPRCGNTFATVAFQLAQGVPVEAAHHLHAEAQIVAAAESGIPAVLLIRDPEDAVVSNARSFGYPLRTALRDYVVFYRRVLPYRDRVVVADFEDVTRDFGAVVDAVNARFGTAFARFDHTDAEVQRCFDVIDEFYRRTAPEPNRTVARPSRQRQVGKDVLRHAFNLPSQQALRDEAYRLYFALTKASPLHDEAARGDGAAGHAPWVLAQVRPPRGNAAPGRRASPPHPDR